MTDTTALHDALDRAIGPGPAGPELDTLLLHGHRTVRRRRARTATAALALVLATAAGSLAVGRLGASPTTPLEPATGISEDPGGLDEPLSGAEIWTVQVRPDGSTFGIGPDAEVTFPVGTEVVRHVDDALGRAPEESSTAYVVRVDGDVRWYLARRWPTGPTTSKAKLVIGVPGVDAATFEDWIAAQGPA